MVYLQPRSSHPFKKSESSVNHLDERIFEKYKSHALLHGQRGFSFLSDYDTKSEKEDESKKIFGG